VMTELLIKIEATLDSEIGHGGCGIEENESPEFCHIKQALAEIESLISEAVNKARLSELDWALSRLNTFGRETDTGALNRAINEIDDNIALVVEELTKTNTHMEGNDE
jgi:hypothetical protein